MSPDIKPGANVIEFQTIEDGLCGHSLKEAIEMSTVHTYYELGG